MLHSCRLPEGESLLERLEKMVRPFLLARFLGDGTRVVAGLQYHLCGTQDTTELAELAGIRQDDHVLDVCCFIGRPAMQMASTTGCRVIGVDIAENVIAVANRIAEVAELDDLVTFTVADAIQLPFPDGTFTVVWNQCSLEHRMTWLIEFDRVLRPGGRLALTFEIKKHATDPDTSRCRWNLDELSGIIARMGYTVMHADDITQRDVESGWKVLDRRLLEQREVYAAVLGESWVNQIHQQFLKDMAAMAAGHPGTGRLIAQKSA
jgi:ubiquinone/menaquinone biosynthesis C-methylase UbiE